MDTLTSLLTAYAITVLIDNKFLQDGLTLPSAVIDLISSTRDHVVFHENLTNEPHCYGPITET
jgi:hypothetical protein